MRINKITATNFMALRNQVVSCKSATFIAAHNGKGKSSLLEAVRAALLGVTARVSLKKELDQLVSEGQKKGSVSVETDGGTYAFALPDGKGTSFDDADGVLSVLLEPARFAAMTDIERRKLLFAATGTKMTADVVRAKLAERGRDSAKIEAVMPLLRSGFEVAQKEAAKRATEAKGAWRAVTGETYGEKKADGWEAAAPEFDAQALADAEAKVHAIYAEQSSLDEALGKANAAYRAAVDAVTKIGNLTAPAELLERRTKKLGVDRKELETWSKKLSELHDLASGDQGPGLACPCCGVALKVVDATALVEFAPTTATRDDLDALAHAKEVVERLQSTVANDERDVAISTTAVAQLQVIGQHDDPASILSEIEKLRAAKLAFNTRIGAATKVADELRSIKARAESAAEKTKSAAQHHADVTEWSAIAADLAPDGIQAELTANATGPMNEQLAALSKTLNWRNVRVNDDLSITASGRAYRLLSESEQWRVDLLSGIALARMTLGVVMIDRFDVLDLPSRADVLDLIDTVTDTVQVIVAGTLKAAPDLGDRWQTVWLGEPASPEVAA